VTKRRVETTLLVLVSAVSAKTRDDAQTTRIVAELIREGRIFDSRGIALRLSLAAARETRPTHESRTAYDLIAGRRGA